MDLLLVSSKKMPDYYHWWFSNNMIPFYEFHKKFLQYLQSQRPVADHWTLKAPFHTCFLEALLAVYPDACIVHTHRDLRETMGSVCSLNFTYNELFEEKLNKAETSTNLVEYWATAVEKSMKFRASLPEETRNRIFLDIYYNDLAQDPIGVVKKIYKHYGYPFHENFEAKMQQWLLENPQGKHGKHAYCLETFGLTDKQIEHRFAEYKKQFNI